MAVKPIRLTQHADTVVQARGITMRWLEAALNNPDWQERDSVDPSLVASFKAIDEFGGRILRVVYDETRTERRVITAYFDRTRSRESAARKP
jgi:hypothetical protein